MRRLPLRLDRRLPRALLPALAVLFSLALGTTALAERPLVLAQEQKLDAAMDLIARTPGFEATAKRLRDLRANGGMVFGSAKGLLAEVSHSQEIFITRKLLREKSIKFIASTLVHETVHLDQDDSRYRYVEEVEFKAYKMGGRFKVKVGIEPETIEKAAMRLTRDQFVREASSILTSYTGQQGRLSTLTLDRESLNVSSLSNLHKLARYNAVYGAEKMTKSDLVKALADRLNRGGLERLHLPSLRVLARQQKLTGYSGMTKAELVDALHLRLDAHRLGVYTFRDLQQMAGGRGIDITGLRSRERLIDTMVRSDVRPRRVKSLRQYKRPASRTRHAARTRGR